MRKGLKDMLGQLLRQDLAGRVFFRVETKQLFDQTETRQLVKVGNTLMTYYNEMMNEEDWKEWNDLRGNEFQGVIGHVAFYDGTHYWVEAIAFMWLAPMLGYEDVTKYVSKIFAQMTSSFTGFAKVKGVGIGKQSTMFEEQPPVDKYQDMPESKEDNAPDISSAEVKATMKMYKDVKDAAESIKSGIEHGEKTKFSAVKQATVVTSEGMMDSEITVQFMTSTYGKNTRIPFKQIGALIFREAGNETREAFIHELESMGYIEVVNGEPLNLRSKSLVFPSMGYGAQDKEKYPFLNKFKTVAIRPDETQFEVLNKALDSIKEKVGVHITLKIKHI